MMKGEDLSIASSWREKYGVDGEHAAMSSSNSGM